MGILDEENSPHALSRQRVINNLMVYGLIAAIPLSLIILVSCLI